MKHLWILNLLGLSLTALAYAGMPPLNQRAPGTHYHESNSACHQATDEQAAVLRKAEREKYLIRRVEFIGNAKTRDSVLRRRILLQEGNVFTRRILNKSLVNVSKVKMIYPVRLSDVVGELNEEEKTLDVIICFKEKVPYPAR